LKLPLAGDSLISSCIIWVGLTDMKDFLLSESRIWFLSSAAC